MIVLKELETITGVRHAFHTRNGGVSDGIFKSLNCGFGSGDTHQNVATNRKRALASMHVEGAALVTAYQQHTATAVVVDTPWQPDQAPIADGLVTTKPGIALGILTADCAPVLFADRQSGVIGAAHAGWRGAIGGVLENTIDLMLSLGSRLQDITAAIGPCIAAQSYEVSDDFRLPFIEADGTDADLFTPAAREGHLMFDLPAYVHRRLTRHGIQNVSNSACDTCGDADNFFSYRRSTKRDEPDYGRGLSAITLAA